MHEEPGFLGEEPALVPEPVLDGADLQDGWLGLGVVAGGWGAKES